MFCFFQSFCEQIPGILNIRAWQGANFSIFLHGGWIAVSFWAGRGGWKILKGMGY